jgi:hypothetical protein
MLIHQTPFKPRLAGDGYAIQYLTGSSEKSRQTSFRLGSGPLANVDGMNRATLADLDLHSLELLSRRCEHLIREQRAGLEEYELYVACQYELARRRTRASQFDSAARCLASTQ